MQTLFGVELSPGLKWLIAIAATLVLLALFGLIARRITGGKLRMRGQGGARARQPRLGVVDVHDLDNQRQLVLIRRDNVEHLVMIGGASDVVVETNILRSGARVAAPIEQPLSERLAAPEPIMPPESLRAEPRRNGSAPPPMSVAPEPLPPLPTRVPPPAMKIETSPLVAAPAVAAAAAVAAAPSFARDHAPAPAASAVELDDMARQLEEALKRPFSAVRASGAPAIEQPAPEKPAPEKAAPEKPAPESAPKVEAAAPIVTPTAAPIVASPVSGRPVPVPLDVGASLEMALGLKPEPAVKAAPADLPPAKPPADIAPASGKVATVPVPAVKPDTPAAPVMVEPRLDPPLQPSESKVAPESVAVAPKPIPVEEPRQAAKAEPAPAPVPAAPEPKPEAAPVQIDPFSVDAIEAEFARLLGRDPKPKA